MHEWAAEIGGGAGMKERTGWIQPDLKLQSSQQNRVGELVCNMMADHGIHAGLGGERLHEGGDGT